MYDVGLLVPLVGDARGRHALECPALADAKLQLGDFILLGALLTGGAVIFVLRPNTEGWVFIL